MPGRRMLRGVAGGLAGSFASRNNDHRGYWAPGVLYAHALRHQVRTVRVDLLSQQVTPHAVELVPIAARYRELLAQHLAAQNFDPGRISSAEIVIEFDAIDGARPCHRDTYGDPFVCTVLLGYDGGKSYVGQSRGHVAPHDPAQEIRRYEDDWG